MENKPRFCGWCSKLLDDSLPGQRKYCTPVDSKDGCGREVQRAIQRDSNRRKKEPSFCKKCGTPFPKTTPANTRFCGDKKIKGTCANKRQRETDRARYLRKSKPKPKIVIIESKDKHSDILKGQQVVYQDCLIRTQK